jgi:hypothetical protein
MGQLFHVIICLLKLLVVTTLSYIFSVISSIESIYDNYFQHHYEEINVGDYCCIIISCHSYFICNILSGALLD